MDLQLTFEDHIKHLCKTSFFHLGNIAKLHPMLTFVDAEKLVSSSTPLSPPGWTIVMRFSLWSLAKASRSCSTFRTVLLGSWWGCANMIISLPSLNRSIGSLSHLGLSISCPSSPTSVSMVMPPPPTSRNVSLYNALHVPSTLFQHIFEI